MKQQGLLKAGAALALVTSYVPMAVAGVVTSKGADIVIDTTGGLKIGTVDKQFSFKLGGRAMWDFDSYDGALTSDDDRIYGGDLRRSRLELSGVMFKDWKYIFTINVGQDSSAKVNFSSIGLTYTGWDWGTVFIGRTKEPFGLEELTSSKSISTIERAYWVEATDVDSNGNYGVRFDGFTGYGLGWSAALNNPSGGPTDDDLTDPDDSAQENIAFTGRLFWAPFSEYGNTLHFGAGFTDRGIDEAVSTSGFKLDIAEHGGKLDSRKITIDEDQQWNAEVLYVNGPFSFQSEYFHRELDGADSGPDGEVDAYYMQLTYSLTGESRGYKRKKGYADIIKPNSSTGAWELVLKYDFIEFDQDGFEKEEAEGFLLGANYYPNKNLKFMFNYIMFDSDDVAKAAGKDEDADVISMRMQYAF